MTPLSTVDLLNHPEDCSLIPENSLRLLQVQQIVDHLLEGECYQQMFTALQEKIGNAVENIQPLLSKLMQEAVQFTLQSAQQSAQPTLQAEQVRAEIMPVADAIAIGIAIDAVNNAVNPVQAIAPVTEILPVKKAIDKAKVEEVLTERDVILRELGHKIQQIRLAKGISLSQLYSLTYVPMHHLKSLEEGQTRKLPEDIFLRGFLQRICAVLELDGEAIVAQIPMPVEAKRIVPKWQQSKSKGSLGLNLVPSLAPAHLYVGYAVLMAGAVSGLAAVTQPVKSGLTEYPTPVPEPNAQFTPETKYKNQSQQPQAKPVSAINMASPEMM